MKDMQIRPVRPSDSPALWRILEPVIRAGETYRFVRPRSGARLRGDAVQFRRRQQRTRRPPVGRLGFAIVGRLPGAFRHPRLGDVDAPAELPAQLARARAAFGDELARQRAAAAGAR